MQINKNILVEKNCEPINTELSFKIFKFHNRFQLNTRITVEQSL